MTLAGGGSPEKDWVLATSLLEASRNQDHLLEYMIIDISTYMIQESARTLYRRIVKNDLHRRINLCWENKDVLMLDVRFRRPLAWKSAVWALLGGTIGNMQERDLFRSIDKPSKVGDLLVVGVDTLDTETPDQLEERMSAEYRCKELDALLLTPLGLAGKPAEDEPLVKVSVAAKEDESRYSDVPNSLTAVFTGPSLAANMVCVSPKC